MGRLCHALGLLGRALWPSQDSGERNPYLIDSSTQPQNSKNPKSVSQYDVAGFQQCHK